jgi:hypothetical protein
MHFPKLWWLYISLAKCFNGFALVYVSSRHRRFSKNCYHCYLVHEKQFLGNSQWRDHNITKYVLWIYTRGPSHHAATQVVYKWRKSSLSSHREIHTQKFRLKSIMKIQRRITFFLLETTSCKVSYFFLFATRNLSVLFQKIWQISWI